MLGGAADPGRARCSPTPADGFWSERGRRLGRGRDLSQPGFAGCVQVRLQPGGRDWQRSTLQRGFWRRPHRRRGQHQQGNDDSRVQSQEPLQPVAVHLRPNHGPRRPDHHASAACVAIGSPAAAAEFVQPQFTRNAGLFWRDAECAAGAAHTAATVKNLGIDRDRFDGRGRPSSISY